MLRTRNFVLAALLCASGVASGQPVDYAAEHNAQFEGLAMEDRAWPVYAELQALLGPHMQELAQVMDAEPGSPGWESATDLCANVPEFVELVEQAANRARLGWAWTDTPPVEWVRAIRGPDAQALERPAEFILAQAILPYAGAVRTVAAMARVETLRLAETGEHDRAIDLIELMPMLVDHLGETRTSLTSMAAASTEYLGIVVASQQLIDHFGDELSDAQLDRLGSVLDQVEHDRFDVSLVDDDRIVYLDTLQRAYTAEVEGKPALSIRGAVTVLHLGGGTIPPEFVPGSPAPKEAQQESLRRFRERVLTYDEVRAGWAEIWQAMVDESRTPMWEREANPGEGLMRAQSESARAESKAALHLLFVRSFPQLSEATESLRLQADAARLALALERSRRATGTYPASLDALVPVWIDAIPADWVDGNAMRYLPDREGKPVLYSLGPDGDDDAGQALEDAVGRRYLYPSERAAALAAGAEIPDGDWVLWP